MSSPRPEHYNGFVIDYTIVDYAMLMPRVKDYRPQIGCRVKRVAAGKHAWRWEALVDGTPMATGHTCTKKDAEEKAMEMMQAYTEVHYEESK